MRGEASHRYHQLRRPRPRLLIHHHAPPQAAMQFLDPSVRNRQINPVAIRTHFKFPVNQRVACIRLQKCLRHVAIPQFIAPAIRPGVRKNSKVPIAAHESDKQGLPGPQQANLCGALRIGVLSVPVTIKLQHRRLLPRLPGWKSFLVRLLCQPCGYNVATRGRIFSGGRIHLRNSVMHSAGHAAEKNGRYRPNCLPGQQTHCTPDSQRAIAPPFPRASIGINPRKTCGKENFTVPSRYSVEVRTEPKRRNPEEFQHVKHSIQNSVARMTLSRPEHNLLNESMLRELADGISWVAERDDVKLIVLDSACKVFCGGIDIGEYTSERVFQMIDAFHAVFNGILESSKPVLSVVNGPAIGGGAELAFFGDLVVATPKAKFAQPEITIGFFPPLASTMLPFLIGPKLALELVLLGQPVTAERALELGLINRLVPEAKLQETVNDLITRITSHSGPVLTMAKKAIIGGMGMSLRDGLKNSMNIFLNELYRLEDSQEGLRALVEKRKPNWKNR